MRRIALSASGILRSLLGAASPLTAFATGIRPYSFSRWPSLALGLLVPTGLLVLHHGIKSPPTLK